MKLKIFFIVVIVGLFSASYTVHSESVKKSKLSVDTVKRLIIGSWQMKYSDSDNLVLPEIIGQRVSFDANGYISECTRLLTGNRFASFPECSHGEIKYILSQNKDGFGVDIIRIDSKGNKQRVYIVDFIAEDKVIMRGKKLLEMSDPKEWKRISKTPTKLEKAPPAK